MPSYSCAISGHMAFRPVALVRRPFMAAGPISNREED